MALDVSVSNLQAALDRLDTSDEALATLGLRVRSYNEGANQPFEIARYTVNLYLRLEVAAYGMVDGKEALLATATPRHGMSLVTAHDLPSSPDLSKAA
jgi:hypothetical protein